MLDALSRLFDLFPDGLPWPSQQHDRVTQAVVSYDPFEHGRDRAELQRQSRPYSDDWSDPSTWAFHSDGGRRRQDVSTADYDPFKD